MLKRERCFSLFFHCICSGVSYFESRDMNIYKYIYCIYINKYIYIDLLHVCIYFICLLKESCMQTTEVNIVSFTEIIQKAALWMTNVLIIIPRWLADIAVQYCDVLYRKPSNFVYFPKCNWQKSQRDNRSKYKTPRPRPTPRAPLIHRQDDHKHFTIISKSKHPPARP